MDSISRQLVAPGYSPDFVRQVLDDARHDDARIYGITGLQGTGKSTLAAQVSSLAKNEGLRVAVLSIDDFYLDHDVRLQLARQVHPLLATRGPPGTHDVGLACDTVDALRGRRPVALPQFDKIDDRRLPPESWPVCQGCDLVILEGWFLKTPPEDDAALTDPINELESGEDPDGIWRRYCNNALGREYPQLWQHIDRMLFLQGPGFEVVPLWRWQQEQTLQAANPGRKAMAQQQVERFVQFFERTSRQAMQTLPAIAERTIRIDHDRNPIV